MIQYDCMKKKGVSYNIGFYILQKYGNMQILEVRIIHVFDSVSVSFKLYTDLPTHREFRIIRPLIMYAVYKFHKGLAFGQSSVRTVYVLVKN